MFDKRSSVINLIYSGQLQFSHTFQKHSFYAVVMTWSLKHFISNFAAKLHLWKIFICLEICSNLLSKFWPKHSSKFWLKHYGQKLILKYISLKFKVKWQMIGKLSSLGFNFKYCARCLTQLSVSKNIILHLALSDLQTFFF